MKYKKLDINDKLFGPGFIVYDWKEDADKNTIYVKSTVHTDVCPICGEPVHKLHNTYHRLLQTVPLKGKLTYVDVNAYKYDCLNKECQRKVLTQELPFASPSQRRTDDLNCLILAVSCFLSNEGASKVLKLIGVDISNDGIKRLTDKIVIEDDPNVERIGIDDVATRKGQTYATVIYDMDDHHMLALLDGRSKDSVVPWLKEHKKINLVARDRASAYASAINEVLPECTQVADRFHLLQNLIDKMKEIFKVELPPEIFIRDGKILDENQKKEKVLKIDPTDERLKAYNYDNSEPVDENGIAIIFDKSATDKKDKAHIKHAKSRKKNKQ